MRSDRYTIETGRLHFWVVLPAATVEEIRVKVRANFPARRLGTAADIGHAAVFLMTNPYVTGTVLEVSGGDSTPSSHTMRARIVPDWSLRSD